jgi:hypothetical protein
MNWTMRQSRKEERDKLTCQKDQKLVGGERSTVKSRYLWVWHLSRAIMKTRGGRKKAGHSIGTGVGCKCRQTRQKRRVNGVSACAIPASIVGQYNTIVCVTLNITNNLPSPHTFTGIFNCIVVRYNIFLLFFPRWSVCLQGQMMKMPRLTKGCPFLFFFWKKNEQDTSEIKRRIGWCGQVYASMQQTFSPIFFKIIFWQVRASWHSRGSFLDP